MYVTYSVVTGEALMRYETRPSKFLRAFCVRFPSEETAQAAWIADATVYQAVNAFGGEEVYNATSKASA